MQRYKILEIWTIFGMISSILGCIGVFFAGGYALLLEIIGFVGFCTGFYLVQKRTVNKLILVSFFLSGVCFVLAFLLLFLVLQVKSDLPIPVKITEAASSESTENLSVTDNTEVLSSEELAENLTSESFPSDDIEASSSISTEEDFKKHEAVSLTQITLNGKTLSYPFTYSNVRDIFPLDEFPTGSFTAHSSVEDVSSGVVCDFLLGLDKPIEEAVVTRFDASVFDDTILPVSILGISLEMPEEDAVKIIESYEYSKSTTETTLVYTIPCRCDGEDCSITFTILRNQGVVGEIEISGL